MGSQQSYEMYGHPSIYKPKERKLKVYFSEPSDGVNEDTGLFPVYLKSDRYVNNVYKNTLISIQFKYLAKTIYYDEELLFLPSLYKKFYNNCRIICYHGTDDCLISNKDKKFFARSVNNFIYNEISSREVDGQIFRYTQHGLDADFIKMFDYAMKTSVKFTKEKRISLDNILYETKKADIFLIIATWYLL